MANAKPIRRLANADRPNPADKDLAISSIAVPDQVTRDLLPAAGFSELIGEPSHARRSRGGLCYALEVAHRQNTRFWELRAATSLARLWCDRGKRIEARDLLAPIYGWFTEGFGTPVLEDAKALLDQLV